MNYFISAFLIFLGFLSKTQATCRPLSKATVVYKLDANGSPTKEPHSYAYPCKVKGYAKKMICNEIVEAIYKDKVKYAHGRMVVMNPDSAEIVATRYLEINDSKPFDPSRQEVNLDDFFAFSYPSKLKGRYQNSARLEFERLLKKSSRSERSKFNGKAKLTAMGFSHAGDAGTLAKDNYGAIKLNALNRLNGFVNQLTKDNTGKDCYELSGQDIENLSKLSTDSKEYRDYINKNSPSLAVNSDVEKYLYERYVKMKINERFSSFIEVVRILERNKVQLKEFVNGFIDFDLLSEEGEVIGENDSEYARSKKFSTIAKKIGEKRLENLRNSLGEIVDKENELSFLEKIADEEAYKNWEEDNGKIVNAWIKDFDNYVDGDTDFNQRNQKGTLTYYFNGINTLRSNLGCNCQKQVQRPIFNQESRAADD